MATSGAGDGFTALVLAGDRGGDDPLLDHTGAPCKALVPLAGKPVIHRVIEALRASATVDDIHLSGPSVTCLEADPVLADWIAGGRVRWRAPENSPAASAHQLMAAHGGDARFLVTTADHPFLDAATVEHFCRRSLELEADVTVGLAPYPLVREAFPAMKKTVLRFRDGEYCGCNLFAFPTAAGRRAADFWRTVERQRKHPLRLVRMLGWRSVLNYRLGRLSLDDALARLSGLMDLRVKAVVLEEGRAAVDVDTVEDYRQVCEKFGT